jgi:ligand-binding sensor domain-containing protein
MYGWYHNLGFLSARILARAALFRRIMGLVHSIPSARILAGAALLLLTFLANGPANAHPLQGLTHLHSGNGLASNVVHHIIQDHLGYLWLGTETGVHRFDGRQVTRFITSDGLGGNEVFFIFEDSQNRLWFLTFNGVLSYYKDGQFHNPTNNPVLAQTGFNNMLTTIFEDHQGRIWVGSLDGSLYVLEDTIARAVQTPDSISLRMGWVADDGSIMIGSTSGVYFYDDTGETWHSAFDIPILSLQRSSITSEGSLFPYLYGVGFGKRSDYLKTIPATALGISSRITSAVLSPDETQLAVGTYNDGIYVYAYQKDSTPELLNHFLPQETVTSVFFDNQNSLWIGTLNNGAFRVDESYRIVVNASLLRNMPDLAMRSIYEDDEGVVWAGTLSGWIYRFDSENTSPSSHQVRTIRPDLSIEHFLKTSQGRMLVGTASGIHELTIGRDIAGRAVITDSLLVPPAVFPNLTGTVKSMLEHSGHIYVGSTTNLMRLSLDNWAEFEVVGDIRITALAMSCDGTLYAGSISGLYRLMDNSLVPVDAPALRNVHVYDITATYNDWIAVATYGNGLIFLNSITGETVQMDRTRGLTDDLVRALYYEWNGTLWVGTSLGLNRFNLDISKHPSQQVDELFETVTSYNESLFHTQIVDIVVTDNLVWLAGSRDILLLDRNYDGQPDLTIPLLLEVVRINENTVGNQTVWDVPHTWNRWHFRFTGILLRDNSRLMYRYRLRRPDQVTADWSITSNNEITFESIAPGNYIFEVDAFSGDGKVSSQTASISILIRRPFWGHPAFWIFLLLFTGGLTAGIVRLRNNYNNKKEFEQHQVRGRINELEHQALQAMMNPHFVFNILNSIRYQILRDEKQHASDMLLRFSKLIRLQLDSNYKREISLREELNRLELYVSLEAERLMKPITFTYTLSSEVDPSTTKIPSMIMQPFVENAVLHGIAPTQNPGSIGVVIQRETGNGQLRINIRDNGTGLKKDQAADGSQSRRLSLGLKLVTERMELMSRQTGLPWSVEVADYYDDNGNIMGVVANVLFPIT